jgi:hypothetical protein
MLAYRIKMIDEIGPAKPFTVYHREEVDSFINGMKFTDDDDHETWSLKDLEWHWLRRDGYTHTRIHVKTLNI